MVRAHGEIHDVLFAHSPYNSTDPNESRYGYTPSRAATIIFVILFGISSSRLTGKNMWLLSADIRTSSSPRSSGQISNMVHAYYCASLRGHGNGGMVSAVLFELSPDKHDGVHDTVSSYDSTRTYRFNYFNRTSVLVLAPTPLLAANFVIFGRLIRKLGERYSRIKPRFCEFRWTVLDYIHLLINDGVEDTIIFTSCVSFSMPL